MASSRSRKRATRAQENIAYMHGIPLEQAHTINVRRYPKYLKWLHTPMVKLEQFLDKLDAQRKAVFTMKGEVLE